MPYRFGSFRADRSAYRLFNGDTEVDLTPKLLDLLFFLLERPAELVTKEALLDGVWPGANVTENALAQAISDLRDALGDRASAPTYIRTVARRGYRFIALVETGATPPVRTERSAAIAAPTRRAIAVLDFANVSGDPDVAWLAGGIAETVTNDLAALDHFRVIDRWRVVQASRGGERSLHEMGAAVGASVIVTGSYQRSGPRLRITARLVDLESGEALADAKVDGPLDGVFELQDSIVSTFAHELGVPGIPSSGRVGVRETSSLDAYRAYTEGLLRIESLDTDEVRASVGDFERAVTFDSGYAMAYTGLASAQFVAYEMSRWLPVADTPALLSGIEHARRAVQLDHHLAEAHATLSFLLVSALDFDEARAAAQHAVQLEPESWRHQYRLGHALWGAPRLKAFERVLALYPQFAYAAFETAMLLVARGDFDAAERLVRRRIDDSGVWASRANRFPAVGFHWLLGALEAAGGRHDAAIFQFEREVSQDARRRLYGPEYGAEALVGLGHAQLADGDSVRAVDTFRRARTYLPEYPKALIGEVMALSASGSVDEASVVRSQVERARDARVSDGRAWQATLIAAWLAAAAGDGALAVTRLHEVLNGLPVCHLGWIIPIDPVFAALRPDPRFAELIARLAKRAA